jgi:hypothetical protein
MANMESWWCIDQKKLGISSICEHYAASERLRDEKEIRSIMKPGIKELDEMHTQFCATLPDEERALAPVCVMWSKRRQQLVARNEL